MNEREQHSGFASDVGVHTHTLPATPTLYFRWRVDWSGNRTLQQLWSVGPISDPHLNSGQWRDVPEVQVPN